MASNGTILFEICLGGIFGRIPTLTKPKNILTTLEQDWMRNIPLYSVEAYFKNQGIGTDN